VCSIKIKARNHPGTEASSVSKSGCSLNPKAHWRKKPLGFSIPQWDTRNVEGEAEVAGSLLWF
ncbi:Hypothetical predicted protein, partial [Marmota monax]